MRPPGHPRDLLAWHALCFAAMALMLVAPVPTAVAATGVALFGLGVVWCVARAVRPGPRASYAALGVCCLAMLVMLEPLVTQRTGASMGHRMAATSSPDGGLLTALLVGALVCVVLVAAARLALAARSPRARAGSAAEVLLAGLMAAMLAGVV